MNIDLHCHSNISDGILSPTELVHQATANGTTMLALTDHDHTGGIEEAKKIALLSSIKFISGVEISVTWRKRTIHIVGLNFDEYNQQLLQKLHENRKGRLQRLQNIAEKLDKKGIKGVYEGALRFSTNPEMVGRVHIAQYLVEQAYVDSIAKAFKKWLGEGKPGYVHHEWMSLSEAVNIITQAQGHAVIAHPARYNLSATAMRNLVEEFIQVGGQGIEVSSSCHSLNERLNYALLANRYQLYASLGSDFHGNGEYNRILGKAPDLPSSCKPIWKLWMDI